VVRAGTSVWVGASVRVGVLVDTGVKVGIFVLVGLSVFVLVETTVFEGTIEVGVIVCSDFELHAASKPNNKIRTALESVEDCRIFSFLCSENQV
jgi:hypothetical protein